MIHPSVVAIVVVALVLAAATIRLPLLPAVIITLGGTLLCVWVCDAVERQR